MKMKQYSSQCEICYQKFFHDKERVVNQMLGYHKFKKHGIPGASTDPEEKRRKARERHWMNKGYSGDKLADLRSKYEAKQSATPTAEGLVRKPKKATDAVPLPLTECPLCHARFYYTAQPKDSE